MLKALKISKETFVQKHPNIEISKLNEKEFSNSLIVQLEARSHHHNHQQQRRISSPVKQCNARKNSKPRNQAPSQQMDIEVIFQSESIDKILHIETTVI